MRVGAIILARIDSRRLPGKALRDLCGKPLIRWAIDTCRELDGIDVVVLATTDRTTDDALADYARSIELPCFRGDCDDVAGRFLAAMEEYKLEGALRFNGDSPLNRKRLLASAVATFREGGLDLVSNVPERTFPYGISAEVVGLDAMRMAVAAMACDDASREHVTKYFYDHPTLVRSHLIRAPDTSLAGARLAIDDAKDLARATWIISELGDRAADASLGDIVRLSRAFDASERRFA